MKIYLRIVIIVLCISCFSCKSTVGGQRKKIDTSLNMKNEKPKFSERDLYKIASPNSIELIGVIMGNENNSIVCNKNHENIVVLKVQKIINSGSGIVNKLHKEKIFKAIFPKEQLLNTDKSPDSIFKKGDLFEVNVLEQMCIDASKTTYLIKNYKKL